MNGEAWQRKRRTWEGMERVHSVIQRPCFPKECRVPEWEGGEPREQVRGE